jgi:light-regulated signal transduction histidine kinase (bacteriophytochrome)
MDQIASLNRKLEQINIEFNEFIYRTSHDVRGPIATIKGLTNVAKLESKCPELDIYFDLISKVANRLDLILEHLNGTASDGDEAYSEFGIGEFIAKMITRISKLKELYDLNFKIAEVSVDAERSIKSNPAQIFVLAENLMLILASSRYLYNINYSVQLGSNKEGLLLDVVYENVKINFITSAIEQFLSDGKNERDIRGYNDMRIRIVNRCLKLTGASVNILEEGNKSIIRIFIPSIKIVNDVSKKQ